MQLLSLIICATPRSGSYYLLDLLNQSGLPYGEEWLTPYHISTRKRIYGENEALAYDDYLQLLSQNERSEGRFVLKAMFPQFNELLQYLESTDNPCSEMNLSRMGEIFPNPRFIYLERRDKLAQAISHLRAKQTGRWVNLKENAEEDTIQPNYSFLGIQNELDERERMEHGWERIFKDLKLDVLRLQFESIKEDPQDAMNRVFSYLKIGHPKKLELVQQRFKPMGSELNKSWRLKFEEDLEISSKTNPPRRENEVRSVLIRDTTVQASYLLGGNNFFKVFTESGTNSQVNPVGRTDGSGWLRITGTLTGENTREWFQQELKPFEGNSLTANCLLPNPPKPGRYTLRLVVADQVLMPGDIEKRDAMEISIEFVLPQARAQFRELVSGIVDMPNGWQRLDWFGYFMDDKYPWIYHAEHEWLFVGKNNRPGKPIQMLDANMGWIEIDSSSYPVIRSLERDERWEFLGRNDNKRAFRNLATGDTFFAETNRPEHLKNL